MLAIIHNGSVVIINILINTIQYLLSIYFNYYLLVILISILLY